MPSSGHYSKGPEALIASLAARGDRDAFAELVRRRQSWIRNLMRRCSGDAVLADDLGQQVFMQAWRRIRQLRDPGNFGPWLKQIAVNEWLQHLRKHDPLRNADDEDKITGFTVDRADIGFDLDTALATLPGPVSLCIVLSYYERMSHAEIAALTRMQLGTVKSHIRRGSERLKKLLAAYESAKQEGGAR